MRVQGFSAAACAAGIKYKNRPDLGLIFSAVPAVAAGVFTTNKVKAAPVLLSQKRLEEGRAQAILVNSGNANACTGEAGMQAAQACSGLVSRALNIEEKLVVLGSTGVIGLPMPVKPFAAAIPGLVRELGPEKLADVAHAMMTTDTVEKIVTATVNIGGKTVSLYGMAKGSGMIRPDMATMLCFLLTDANIDFASLDRLLHEAVEDSFNTITVDGDTSTNDTVLVLANGLAGNACINEQDAEGMAAFGAALSSLCQELALKIVADGEGATKLVHIRVKGAATRGEAKNAARTIAESPLVKTALFGEDANWGRIIAALGRSSCAFRPETVRIFFDGALLVEAGQCLGEEAEARAAQVLRQKELSITVELREGGAEALVHTCDFSLDYVKINADYRS